MPMCALGSPLLTCFSFSQEPLSAERAHGVLIKVRDEVFQDLGFDPLLSRPDWMLVTVMPIPPPSVRPSVVMGGSGLQSEVFFLLTPFFLVWYSPLFTCHRMI